MLSVLSSDKVWSWLSNNINLCRCKFDSRINFCYDNLEKRAVKPLYWCYGWSGIYPCNLKEEKSSHSIFRIERNETKCAKEINVDSCHKRPVSYNVGFSGALDDLLIQKLWESSWIKITGMVGIPVLDVFTARTQLGLNEWITGWTWSKELHKIPYHGLVYRTINQQTILHFNLKWVVTKDSWTGW